MSPLPHPIEPATPAFRDGTIYSETYGDTYWSRDGGLDETRHVFLSGNGLPARWQACRRFAILETGFGAGLNFLCAWKSFRESAPADAQLHYLSVDKHPFRVGAAHEQPSSHSTCPDLPPANGGKEALPSPPLQGEGRGVGMGSGSGRGMGERLTTHSDNLALLYRHWPQLAPLGDELLERYPPLVPGFHRLHLDGGRVHLTLLWGDAARMLAQVDARIDAFFLDGFAPSRNPEMWSEALFAQLKRLAAPGATFATYSAAGKVWRGMTAAGFNVRKEPGFGRKREMLCGHVPGAAQAETPRARHALIIGGGIAGCLAAERLAARGWTIDLIERRDAPARETSGNPAGVLQPVPSADGNRLARLTIAGFHYALRQLRDFSKDPQLIWRQCGVLRLARNDKQIERQQRIAAAGLLPPDVLRWVDIDEASAIAGWRVPAPGWWFPQGAWVHPPSLCAAALRAAGAAVRVHTQREAANLLRGENGWRAVDAAGKTIAEAPVAILANGHLARHFKAAASLPLRPVRGQITCIPAEENRLIKTIVAREGYVTPATSFGVHVVGATYEEGASDALTRDADHRANLERLENLLPDFAATVGTFSPAPFPEKGVTGAHGLCPLEENTARVAGRAGIRCVGPDRLPLIGAIPGSENLFGLLGLGSRGLVYAPLGAELLACEITGEPLPLEKELAAGLTPAARMKI